MKIHDVTNKRYRNVIIASVALSVSLMFIIWGFLRETSSESMQAVLLILGVLALSVGVSILIQKK